VSRRKVGAVDFDQDENDEYVDGVPDRRRNCPHCEKFELIMKLGPRRTPKGREIRYDNDLFLECYHCGSVYPKYEIERQKTLKADTKQHKSDNPFELGETVVESVPNRTSPAGRKAAAKRKRERQRAHHSDKDIDREIQQYGEENVHVIYDSDP
jgi:hypothetical protein